MVFEILNKFSFLIVQSVVVVVSASYYQKEYPGYLFTIPSANVSAEWRTQADAQNWCNQNGSKLLAITNTTIHNAALVFMYDVIRQNQLSWDNIITDGKRTSDNNWRWINGTSTSTSTSPLSIGGQDISKGYALSYVYLYTATTGFSLFAAQPTDKNYYICEFPGKTSCFNGFQNGSQCFQSFNENFTWFGARYQCLLRGGDLATFEFIKTNDGLNSLSGSWINSSTQYWIGLRRQLWTWQSINSDVTFSNWADGQPVYYTGDNFDCVCLVPYDGRWKGCRCTDLMQFICIRASSSSSGYSASTSVSTTLRTTTQSSSTSTRSTSMLQPSLQSTTTPQFSTPSENASNHDSNNSIKGSSMSVGLGVGLGVGIPALLAIIALVGIVIHLKRKLRKKEPESNVTSVSPSAYESLKNGTRHGTNSSASNYMELNIQKNDSENNVTSASLSAYESLKNGTKLDTNNPASNYLELIN